MYFNHIQAVGYVPAYSYVRVERNSVELSRFFSNNN